MSDSMIENNKCFIILPMGKDDSEIRRRSTLVVEVVKEVTSEFDLELIAPWDLAKSGVITQEIAEHLREDLLVIADLTDGNPNVFYELAVRHFLRLPCVQIIEKGQLPPFDLATTRTIELGSTFEEVRVAQKLLRNTIEEVLRNQGKPADNALVQYLDVERLNESMSESDRSVADVLTGLHELSSIVSPLGRHLDSTAATIIEQIRELDARNEEVRHDFAKGIVETGDGIYRALKYDKDSGVIYYRSETSADERNVLLNAETLKVILSKAKTLANGSEGIKKQGPLYEIGHAASSRFADHFQDIMIQKHGRKFDLVAWLHDWIDYDADAGFGAMQVMPSLGSESDTDHVEIILENSFLTHAPKGTKREDDSLCEFMVGYIAGLLESLSDGLYTEQGLDPNTIQVTHRWEECQLLDPRKPCVFRVEVKKMRKA